MSNCEKLIDPLFIVQLQVAIVGVIVVCGLFYIWRSVCRIEDKVDRLQLELNGCVMAKQSGGTPQPHTQPHGMCPFIPFNTPSPDVSSTANVYSGDGSGNMGEDDDDMDEMNEMNEIDACTADALMKSVFGDVFVLSSVGGVGGPGIQSPQNTGVQVTEIIDALVSDNSAKREPIIEDEVESSIAESDTRSTATPGKLSKTKLKAMSVNMLKELCTQRGLDSEGSKSVLIDRLLQ